MCILEIFYWFGLGLFKFIFEKIKVIYYVISKFYNVG